MNKFLLFILFLTSCGGDMLEKPSIVSNLIISSAMIECISMKQLWQVECLCDVDGCMSRHHACFWDMSKYGLDKYPEMTELYNIFHNEMLECRQKSKMLSDITACEDLALENALIRCEKKLEE